VKGGGAEGDRTLDLQNAILALSQLSYRPTKGDGYYRGVLCFVNAQRSCYVHAAYGKEASVMKQINVALVLFLVVTALAFSQEAPPTPPAVTPPAETVSGTPSAQVEAPAPAAMAEPAPAPVTEASTTASGPSPKFVVFLPERIDTEWFWFYYTEEIQHVVQSAVEKALVSKGLEVLDVSAGDALSDPSGTIQQITSKDFAVQKAKQMGATYVIVGTATADRASTSTAYGVNVVRASADISARLVRVADAKILVVEDASATAGGEAVKSAGRDALKQAGSIIARKLASAAQAAADTP
jgi:hypothetical protein